MFRYVIQQNMFHDRILRIVLLNCCIFFVKGDVISTWRYKYNEMIYDLLSQQQIKHKEPYRHCIKLI